MKKVNVEVVSSREVKGRDLNNSSKVEYRKLAFFPWRLKERVHVPLWGPTWNLDSGEKNRILGVVFHNSPWAREIPVVTFAI